MAIKVVVIDDKPLIRKAIIHYVDWDSMDCVVAGEASNGLDGCRLIEEQQPEIVVTDIKMPGCDGLELARLAKRVVPEARIVIITGYQEFEYAHKAVKIGAFDFILKPIHYPELQRVIRMAAEELQALHRQQSDSKQLSQERFQLERQVHDSVPLYRSKFVNDLIVGGIQDADAIRESARRIGLDDTAPHAVILVRAKRAFQSDVRPDQLLTYAEKLLPVLRRAASSTLTEFAFESAETMVYRDVVLVMQLRAQTEQGEASACITRYADLLQEQLDGEEDESYYVAVSPLSYRLDQLRHTYVQAAKRMEARFFQTETIASGEPGPAGSWSNSLNQWIAGLEQTDEAGQIAWVGEAIKRISASSGDNIQLAKGLLIEVCYALRNDYIRRTGDELGLDKTADQTIADVHRLTDLQEAFDYLAQRVREIRRGSGDGATLNPIVRQVRAFIAANYAQNLSLSYTARHMDLNPSYLSRILSQETGFHYVELVTRARIDAAKRLLRNPKYRISEVCDMVGFKDYNYFYQNFKKYAGVSPTAYKNEQTGLT